MANPAWGEEGACLLLQGKGFNSTCVGLGIPLYPGRSRGLGTWVTFGTHVWATQVLVGFGQLRYKMSLNSKIPPSLGRLISWKLVPPSPLVPRAWELQNRHLEPVQAVEPEVQVLLGHSDQLELLSLETVFWQSAAQVSFSLKPCVFCLGLQVYLKLPRRKGTLPTEPNLPTIGLCCTVVPGPQGEMPGDFCA